MSRPRGFTLIELLVVISIIGLLSSVVLASLNSARDKGRLAAGKQFEANVYHAEADQAVGIWDFDDCTGTGIVATTALDTSGNGNSGTPAGNPLWSADTPSGSGCSLSLNGTTQYIQLPSTSVLSVNSIFTVSAWIKMTTVASTWNFILAGPGADIGVGVATAPSNSMRLTKVTVIDAPASTLSISINQWHHVAFVFSNNAVTYYLDGQADGSGAFAQTFTPGAKRIGATSSGGATAFFTGLLDAVRLYAKDLTATEVGKLYASEAPRFKVAAK